MSKKKRKAKPRVSAKSKSAARRLAKRIAAALFTAGDGHRARLLCLTDHENNLHNFGGWCESSVATVIGNMIIRDGIA